MFFPSSCQVLLLWAAFLVEDVQGFCEQLAWKSVGWQFSEKKLEQLPSKKQANCLHKTICQMCHCFTGMGLSNGCPEVIYTSCKAVLILVICLSIVYLFSKLQRIKSRQSPQGMVQTSAVSISAQMYEENNHNRMINKLVANTSKIKKYMKCIALCDCKVNYRKSNRRGRSKNWEFSPLCSNYHSSTEEETMHDF